MENPMQTGRAPTDQMPHREITQELAASARALSKGRPLALLSRLRFQVLTVLLAISAGTFLPILAGFSISDVSWSTMWTPMPIRSFFWSLSAGLAGLALLRGLVKYPGLSMGPYVLPALVISFTFVVLVMFFFRIDYSRYVLGTAFLSAFIWMQICFYLLDRSEEPILAVVPEGQVGKLNDLVGARWTTLQDPGQLPTGMSGIVADLRSDIAPQWERFIAKCTLAGIPVYDLKGIAETLTGKCDIAHISETTFGSVLPSNSYLRLKRVLDVLVAILLLTVFLPIILIAAIFIKLDSPGPVFFKQERIGYRAQVFQMYKLRSMRTDIDGGRHFTAENDPRITRVGRFIRKFRIDEFPQIFNIIKGDMSWIGPRPEAVELSYWYSSEIPFYIYRQAVLPGITGWAQVNQGNVAEVDSATEKLRFDFYYIKHFSPFLDMLIVLRTIHTMMTGFGSR